MMRQPVKSSNIREVGYDAPSQTLEVQFRTGGVYQYLGVPHSVYQGLMQAASHGSYFQRHVRNRYSYRRVR